MSRKVLKPCFEAMSTFLGMMTVLWLIPKHYQFSCFALIFIAIIWSFIWNKNSIKELGFKATNLKYASLLLVSVILIVTFFAIWGWHTNGALKLGPMKFLERVVSYYPWAFLQQFLLNSYFANKFLRATQDNKNHASFYAGALFSIIHLPNPFLFVITLVLGPLSARLFFENRNLYILALAHAIIGTSLGFISGAPGFSMRVGPGYLQ